jgi:PAS domain S-box-containing protein
LKAERKKRPTRRINHDSKSNFHSSDSDMTELKKIKQLLKDSEEKYHATFETASTAIATVDNGGIVLEYNRKAAEMFGVDRKEMLGRTFRKMMAPESAGRAMNELKRVGREGHAYGGEYKMKRKRGNLIDVLISSTSIKDRVGKFAGAICVLEDITERKFMESVLKESEEKYRTIFNSTSDALFVIQPDKKGGPGKFIAVNNVTCDMLGYTYKEMLEMSPDDISDAGSRSSIRQRAKDIFKNKYLDFETTHIAKNGRRIPFEIHARIFDLMGVPTVMAAGRDMTERRKTELQQAEQARYKELRAQVWKLAADKTVDESSLIQGLVDKLGPVIDAERVVFSQIAGGRVKATHEWKRADARGTAVGTSAPAEMLEKINIKDQLVVDKDSAVMLVPEKLRPIMRGLQRMFVKRFGDHQGLLTICYVNEKKEGVITCVKKEGTVETWPAEIKAIVLEAGRIISSAIEQRRVEKELQDSEFKYRTLFESASDAVYVHRPLKNKKPGPIIAANRIACERMGYTEEEFKKMTIMELNAPETMSNPVRTSKQIFIDGKISIETLHMTKDGRKIPVEINARLFELGGKPTIISSARDITDRNKAAEKEQLTARMNSLRADVWEIIADKSLKENEIIQGIIDRLGPELNVSRVSYNRIIGNNQICVLEWKAKGAKPTIGVKISQDLLSFVMKDKFYDISLKNADEIIPKFFKPAAKAFARLLSKVFNIESIALIPFYIEGKPEGSITFDVNRDQKVKPEWDGRKKEILLEIVNIMGQNMAKRRAERATEESEELFRTAFVTSPDSVNINRLGDGMYLDINEGFTKLTGYTKDDVKDKTSRDINIWNNLNDRERLVAGLKKHGFVDNLEAEFRMKDGRVKTGLMSAKVIKIKGVPHILNITRDMTERLKAQEAIRESEQKFRSVISQTGQLVYDYNVNSGVIKWEGAIKEITGYDPVEFNREVSIDIRENMIHPDDRERAVELLENARSSCGKYIAEYRFVHKDGSYRHMLDEGIFSCEVPGKADRMLGVMKDITDRKRSEEALRESEEKFRGAFMTSPDAMILSRISDGILLDANSGFEKITGYSREESMNKTAEAIYLWKKTSDRDTYMKELMRKGSAKNVELDFRKKDGTIISAMVSANIIKIHGESCIIAAAKDISERKAAENALRDSEEKFRAIFETSPDAININRLSDGVYLEANIGFEKVSGYTRQETAGHTGDELGLWESPELRRELVNEVKKKGRAENAEIILKKKDGRRIYALISSAIINLKGEACLLSISRDITDRKNTEEALKESEEKFRTLSDQSLIGITILQDGKFRYFNQAFLKMTGFTAEKMNVMSENEYGKYIHPDDLHVLAHRAVEDGEIGRSNSYQFRIIGKSEKITWLDVYSKNIIFDGRQANFITQVDITDLKDTEEKLKRTIIELERSNAELERFAYVASHDLQEPLRMVSSYVQLLERRYKDKLGPDADEFINYAVDGAARMQKLIKDLLAYSRLGTREKQFGVVDAGVAFLKAQENLKGAIEEKKAEIKSGSLPKIKADEVQVIQLFQNLLSNSLKFSGKEGPCVIEISAEKKAGEWQFCIRDNGIGIDKKYFEKIFIIFQRLHAVGEYPGTGIGLAICKRIVENHGGRIWLESEEGRGAAFYFTIPDKKP